MWLFTRGYIIKNPPLSSPGTNADVQAPGISWIACSPCCSTTTWSPPSTRDAAGCLGLRPRPCPEDSPRTPLCCQTCNAHHGRNHPRGLHTQTDRQIDRYIHIYICDKYIHIYIYIMCVCVHGSV